MVLLVFKGIALVADLAAKFCCTLHTSAHHFSLMYDSEMKHTLVMDREVYNGHHYSAGFYIFERYVCISLFAVFFSNDFSGKVFFITHLPLTIYFDSCYFKYQGFFLVARSLGKNRTQFSAIFLTFDQRNFKVNILFLCAAK